MCHTVDVLNLPNFIFVIMVGMGKSRPILAFMLLLLWTTAPTLRCLVPGEVLTVAEQACCKAMGGQCGGSSSPDHPCCKRTLSSVQAAMATASSQVTVSTSVAALIVPVIDPVTEQGFSASWLVDASPPPILETANPVLRI